ncbi:polysaccharide deacetylase family protein [Leeia aquatica]|uniref:Polysaccharide deacetylase family protein n=1 Tax=Leeia aquatica TaxID=2725557 RepID=A0A847S9Z8_9NEIS|nr:polysaccharide deacetylase family protein [Leeia aquatica]NLR75695.1 polysaccharide deacetylase family protein [Leeia aquatica]
MFRWLGYFLLVLPGLLCAHTLALTFDDGFSPEEAEEAAVWNQKLLDGLAAMQVQSLILPAGKRVESEAGMALLRQWSVAGHQIGNHTHCHKSLSGKDMTLTRYTTDIQRAERLLSVLPGWTPRFRYPYLKEGDTLEKRDGVRRWLSEHGYQVAAVSIDTSDWYYNERFLQLLKEGKTDRLPTLQAAYLNHLWDRAQHYDQLAQSVLHRSPSHVMLLHTNALNAAYIRSIITLFRSRGWEVVSPRQAYADPLYAMTPDTLPAGESLLWSLAKAQGLKGLRYPAEDGQYEAAGLDAALR